MFAYQTSCSSKYANSGFSSKGSRPTSIHGHKKCCHAFKSKAEIDVSTIMVTCIFLVCVCVLLLALVIFFVFQTIDALDPWEGLTELGHHLLDLPIDPRLGKMVLYSVILKCLDPILTITCALAHKDPCEFHSPFIVQTTKLLVDDDDDVNSLDYQKKAIGFLSFFSYFTVACIR